MYVSVLNAPVLQGAAHVVRQVLATDGIRGLYRGFGIVVVGVIPARGVGFSWDTPCLCIAATVAWLTSVPLRVCAEATYPRGSE